MQSKTPHIAVFACTLALGPNIAGAGPQKVVFPGNYAEGVMYGTLDRPDLKQFREMYTSAEAVKAIREARPVPSGTVITMVLYKAQLDSQGNPVKAADGHFVKGEVAGYAVMEKRAGWGKEYPEAMRNGEWEYSAFTPDKTFNQDANFKACFQCHKPHEKQDYVISAALVAGQTPLPVVQRGAKATDVNIADFNFAPGKITVPPGEAVTWTNTDGSPHQIAINGRKTAVLMKGQSESMSFDQEGTFSYNCSLHPTMKGQIEVKK